MIRYENECCGCATPMYPCRGESCDLRHVAHLYCDHCKEEVAEGDLYHYDGGHWCKDCILDSLDVVEIDE